MRTKNFPVFRFTIVLTVWLTVQVSTFSQTFYPNGNFRDYPEYPAGYAVNPASPSSVYIANREMTPLSPSSTTASLKDVTPAATGIKTVTPVTSTTSPPRTNPLHSSGTNSVTSTAAVQATIPVTTDSDSGENSTPTSEKVSKWSIFSIFPSYGKKNKTEQTTADSSQSTKKELNKGIDDGLETIEAIAKEWNYSEPDYINSATQPNGTAAKDYYKQGLQAESQGDFISAVKHYNAFISANKKQIISGTLAAPYHRLALIAWRHEEYKNAEVYFRYALNYALSGNVPIIAGDYALFLMERNSLSQAEIILRNALTNYPENHRLLFYLGRCTARQDKPMEALRIFTAIIGKDRAYQELALVYRQQGEFESSYAMDKKRNEYLARRNDITPQRVFTPQSPRSNHYVQAAPGGLPVTPPPVIPNAHGIVTQKTVDTPIPFPTFNNPEGNQQVYINAPVNAKPQGIPVVPPEKEIRQPPVPPNVKPLEIPFAQWQANPTTEPQEHVFAQWQAKPVGYQQENIAVQWQATLANSSQVQPLAQPVVQPIAQHPQVQNNSFVPTNHNSYTPYSGNNHWQPVTPPIPPSIPSSISPSVSSAAASPVPAQVGTNPVTKVFYYPSNETTPVYQEF